MAKSLCSALTNLIDTDKPKGRPSSLANGIRQCHAWKRRDGSYWPAAEVSVDACYFRSLGNTGSSRSGSIRRK
jgi:hypothetical protein